LDDPDRVAEGAKARFGTKGVEEFWIALVDNRNRVRAWECVSKGTVDQTAVYPREVLSLALRHEASGMILVHNHPGGNPEPSDEDIRLTMRIKSVAEGLGVRLLDHLVVTDREHFSFQAHGLL
jgi:DNA repair protein RadC